MTVGRSTRCLAILITLPAALAAQPAHYSFDDAQAFLKRHCQMCHQGGAPAGGCDDPIPKEEKGPPYPWTREHSAIDVVGFDGVSDNGQEIYNFFKQEGITNVALMGVHTNICILNRSFGIRQMTRLGFQVVLVRDLTDSMYDPRKRPFVSHTRGTELIIEHIETKWCPSILSDDLTRVVPGSDSPSSLSLRPHPRV